jgi:hypothetical protein
VNVDASGGPCGHSCRSYFPPDSCRCKERLWKIATGGVHAGEETRLMVNEKVNAAVEAGAMLMTGKTSGEVIDFYRKQVAVNATRLRRSDGSIEAS